MITRYGCYNGIACSWFSAYNVENYCRSGGVGAYVDFFRGELFCCSMCGLFFFTYMTPLASLVL